LIKIDGIAYKEEEDLLPMEALAAAKEKIFMLV
jgi:hypothetical protein